jgi:hypothetical protein
MARTVTRTGWWIEQRDADGADLLELLNAATETDRGTENPFSSKRPSHLTVQLNVRR